MNTELQNKHCAPNVDASEHYTCFELDELREIAKAFNEYIRHSTVCSKRECVPQKVIDTLHKDKKQLWKSIYSRLSKICKYEYCWVDQSFIDSIPDEKLREKIKFFTFKPKMTLTRYQWLNTDDINKVMQQYQEFDKSFKFLGALPSDFYTQVRVNYDDAKKYKRIGIVFNLDTHDQAGSHWVAFLIDNTRRTIEYFDSVGDGPNGYIKRFIKKLRKRVLLDYTYLQNDRVFQKENTECGVYAIYYIIQRLLGKTFHEITSKVISDRKMNKFRDIIFRPRT